MALVNCPECGRQGVSESAEACPDCGYGIKIHYENIRAEEERQRKIREEQEKKIAEERQRKATEKERQEAAVIRLQRQIDSNKKGIPIMGLLSVVFAALTILCWNKSEAGDLGIFIVICAFLTFFMVVGFFSCISGKNRAEQDLILARQSIDDLERVEEERRKAAEAAAKRQQEIQEAQHPKCPACGSKNTKRITTTNRVVSTSMVGIASSTIGKQYQCLNCKHKW